MKSQRKFIFIFALCWIIGLTGGYFLGVGSAILPTENVEYNYYFSENKSESGVESLDSECSEKANDDESTFTEVIKNLKIFSFPKKVILHFLSPSACNQKALRLDSNKELA